MGNKNTPKILWINGVQAFSADFVFEQMKAIDKRINHLKKSIFALAVMNACLFSVAVMIWLQIR